MNTAAITAYELIKEEALTDIQSTGYLLRHKKTGARVMLIENDEENKVFSIAFRTTPKDSTGVPHILEHSVLCGSREFPLRDPFVNLVKGSLNTFLNAMTYPDKTCYPVASCNDQDFQNLMHVYLDAVFFPNIYQKQEIFRQEGWNYHLEQPQGPLTINGVVYNEMKGAFSSADDVLERAIMNALFPDTTYGVESGGDPACIPTLSYEQFLDFHRTYYHPANSYIYLYGNMDMAEKLDFIDQHYLSRFEPLTVDSQISAQKPFEKCKDETKEYPIAENEGEKDNTYLSYNMVVGEASDPMRTIAFDVLDYALLSAPGAPVKKALLDAGIGKDVYGSFEDGILQPYLSIIAKEANPEQKEDFVRIIRETLEKIVREGVNPKAIRAGINSMEFRYREADYASYPKGLIYGLDILETWLYDDAQPFTQVKQLEIFDKLKQAVGTGYYEQLIRTYLLENGHGAVLSLVPKRGLATQREKELAEELEAYRKTLSAEELEQLVQNTKNLEAYQNLKDSPEALACIPVLKRTDIKREAEKLTNEPLSVDGNLFLYHEVDTRGIAYVDLMFDVRDMEKEAVNYLGLLKSVLGYVDTEHYTYGELFNEINAHTGGLNCGVEVFGDAEDPEKFRAMFSVRGKTLYPELGFWFEMAREILNTSRLSDTRRLYEILAQVKSRAQASLAAAGHQTAVLRCASYSSPMAVFQDEMAGIDFYQFVEHLEANFEAMSDIIVEKLQKLLQELLDGANLSISYTGERSSLAQAQEQFRELKTSLPQAQIIQDVSLAPCTRKNEGFTTAGQVQYVARTGNFVKKGYAYSGALNVLKVALGYDFLWNNIREKGGAYGCMSGFQRNGESFFVSYRDPHLRRTLEVYDKIPQYVRSFDPDEREMTKYIIGTISSKDVPRTPLIQGSLSKVAWFSGFSEEMIQKERDEILDATAADIRALAPLVEAVLSDEQICVIGSESVVEKDQDVLMEVKPLVRFQEEDEDAWE